MDSGGVKYFTMVFTDAIDAKQLVNSSSGSILFYCRD